jgi:hypothetical protein
MKDRELLSMWIYSTSDSFPRSTREHLVPAGCTVVDDGRSISVYRDKPQAWTGAGLPPVGTVCEFNHGDEWLRCEVVARKNDLAICWIHCNKILTTGGRCLRPLRTPEQIKAEEREVFAKALVFEMGKDPEESPNSLNQARRIYDLGYRKAPTE